MSPALWQGPEEAMYAAHESMSALYTSEAKKVVTQNALVSRYNLVSAIVRQLVQGYSRPERVYEHHGLMSY